MSSNTSSLGALVWCGLGQKGEQEEGLRWPRWCWHLRSGECELKKEGRRGPAGELLGRLRMLLTCGPHMSVRKRRGEGARLACWAAARPICRFGCSLAWLGCFLFFLTNLFLISVFPKQQQNHPKTFQKI